MRERAVRLGEEIEHPRQHFRANPDARVLDTQHRLRQLQNVFRYGLRDEGYLFIGVSETADPELFEPLEVAPRWSP
jgi:hypothetical protein